MIDLFVRRATLAIVINLLIVISGVSALGAALEMSSEVTPSEDRGFYTIMTRSSSGDSVEVLETAISQIERILEPYGESGVISSVQSHDWRGGSGMAFVIVRLAGWADRSTSQQEIMADVSLKMRNVPGLTASVRSSNSLNIRRGGGGGLEFAVAGQDRAILEDGTTKLVSAMGLDSAFPNPSLSHCRRNPC